MTDKKRDSARRFRSLVEVNEAYLAASTIGVEDLVDRTADATQSAVRKHVKVAIRRRG